MKVKLLSSVRLLVTPWTAAYQAPPSMGFSRQEYWNGVPLPSPTYYFYSILIFSFIIFGIYCLPAATEECKLLKGWYIFHSLDISDNEGKINKTVPDT